MISVIVPVCNEAAAIKALHEQRQREPNVEWIVVDGGSDDHTLFELKQYNDWKVLGIKPGGRARQMNYGAQQAGGDVLLFLHADSELPPNWTYLVRNALRSTKVAGGAFHIRYKSQTIPTWLCYWLAFRSRHTRLPYGDQAIFVRRKIFNQLGGFPDQALMEDYEFSRRLRRQGQIQILPQTVHTSARRFEQGGVLRTGVRMKVIWLLYCLGVAPEQLARWYRAIR